MVNLYLYKNSGMGTECLVKWALQSIRQMDVSARPGRINRVLLPKLR